MINLIGTNIKSELLIVYSLIGLVIALIIIILIIDKVNSNKKDDLFSSRKATRSLKKLEQESKTIDTTILEEKNDDEIVPISDIQVEVQTIEETEEPYIEDELEKTQAQIEVEEITRALEEAQKEERVDPYKQFEEEQEQNAIISYEELHEKFDELYDENEKIQYIDDDNLPIDIHELYQKNEEILNPKKVKLDDLNTVKVNTELKTEIKKEPVTGFKSSPVISPVYGIQSEQSQNISKTNITEIDAEIKKTNEFLKTLKELQKNLD